MTRMRVCAAIIAVAVSMIVVSAVLAAPPMPGAIWTTDEDCAAINRNIYFDKCDVYLNGGPANRNDPGLPDGEYYYQVTDPSGAVLLSTAPLASRIVTIAGGRMTSCTQLCPYDDTPNAGGEYKVWVTNTSDYIAEDGADDSFNTAAAFGFDPERSKTDNFKVKPDGGREKGCIAGVKYYDTDRDGVRDFDEIGISCWLIKLTDKDGDSIYAYTDGEGQYSFCDLAAGTYLVEEALPDGNKWVQTGPNDYSTDIDPRPLVEVTASGFVYTVTLGEQDGYVASADGVNFGNVCLGEGGGRTIGYWGNKNGQAEISTHWGDITGSGILGCPILAGLPYTKAAAPYLGSASAIKTFLTNANAVNMQYMLAAQWLGMEMNVLCGYVNGYSALYTYGYSNDFGQFVTVNDLLGLVCTDGAGWDRSKQEAAKNILDWGNNNQNFVLPGPWAPIVYSAFPPCGS